MKRNIIFIFSLFSLCFSNKLLPQVDKPKLSNETFESNKRIPNKSKIKSNPKPRVMLDVKRKKKAGNKNSERVIKRPVKKIKRAPAKISYKPKAENLDEFVDPKPGYCKLIKSEDFHFNPRIDISRNPYEVFPLDFLDAELKLLHQTVFNRNNKSRSNIYELRFTIKVKSQHYYDMFGILIKYPKCSEHLEIFNNKREILFVDEIYEFRRKIKTAFTGYLNLKIGFYDDFAKKFYQEDLVPGENDLLLYLELP